jgi:hypothetical protein
MFGMSLSFKILVVVLLMAATAITTAKFTHDHVATIYQNLALTEKVAIVTREKKVAVLDTKTLAAATDDLRKRLVREQEEKEILNGIIKGHEASATPWCELNAYELCEWNNSTRAIFHGDTAPSNECRTELPGTDTSHSGETPESVDK